MIFKRKKQTANGPIQNFYTGVIDNFTNNFYMNATESIKFKIEFSIDNNDIKIKAAIKNKLTKVKKFSTTSRIIFEGNIQKNGDAAEINLSKVYVNTILVFEQIFLPQSVTYFPTIDGKKRQQGDLSSEFTSLLEPFNDCVAVIGSSRDMLPVPFNAELAVEEISSKNFKQYLYELYLSEKNHPLFEEINDVFNKPPFSFGTISFAKPNGYLEIMVKKDGLRLPIKHIGSGVLQSLYIITMAISNKNKIICVEELEQNLSPSKQIEILAKLQSMILAKQLNQLLLSSHSSVYSKPKLGTIYFLEKNGNQTTVEKITNKVTGKLKSYMASAALPPDTYTEEEFNMNMAEIDKLTEERFRA
jgi:hypothetical protein